MGFSLEEKLLLRPENIQYRYIFFLEKMQKGIKAA